MLTPATPYNLFHRVIVTLSSEGVTESNLDWVDIGDIHLRAHGREYKLDYVHMSRDLLDDGVIEIEVDFGTFEEALECFEDCPFDLTFEDLNSSELFTTVYVGSDHDDITLSFVKGAVIYTHPSKGLQYVPIDADDSVETIETLMAQRNQG